MNNTANFPGPTTPLQDANGNVAQPWMQFLMTLFARTGGSSNPIDLTAVIAQIAAIQAQMDEQSIVPDDVRIQTLLRLFEELAIENLNIPNLSQIFQRINDLELQVADRVDPILATFPTLEAWTAPTLLNGWVNFDATHSPAGFYKDPFGIVHLRGLVKSGTLATAVFSLPLGYRTTYREVYACDSNGAHGEGYIDPSGAVVANLGSNVFFSLDGITFRAA